MKKSYVSPELEKVHFKLNDVILYSPPEGNITVSGNDDTSEPGEDLGGL